MGFKVGDEVEIVGPPCGISERDLGCIGRVERVQFQSNRTVIGVWLKGNFWWFPESSLSLVGGHHRMPDPDVSLEEIEQAQAIFDGLEP